MSHRHFTSRRVLLAIAALLVLGLSADVFAGGCRPRRGYVGVTHYSHGYYNSPSWYYPSRNLRGSCGPYGGYPGYRSYYRYRDRYCGSYYTIYPRRSLYYSGIATFTPSRTVYSTCRYCRSIRCEGSCRAERGRAVRSAEPPANVIIITSADREAAQDPAVIAAAWTLLSDGDPDRALLEFARLASGAPKAAAPKIGYGLAAALIDDDYNAQWALRRALRVDPDGVRSFEVPAGLVARLRELAERYRAKSAESSRPAESQFIAASIHCLLREYGEAQVALEPLLASGDTQRSTLALRDLVAEGLTGDVETLVRSPAPEAEPSNDSAEPDITAQLASSRRNE